MDESLLEIREYQGSGYMPLIDYGAWRVAILRPSDELQPGHIVRMERHLETDEVFVLLHGRGLLLLGGNGRHVDGIHTQLMDGGQLYNVKRSAWHSILLSSDASVLIMENRDTGEANTEYFELSAHHRQRIMDTAQANGY